MYVCLGGDRTMLQWEGGMRWGEILVGCDIAVGNMWWELHKFSLDEIVWQCQVKCQCHSPVGMRCVSSLPPSLSHFVMRATCSVGHVQDWYMEKCSVYPPPPLSLISHIAVPLNRPFLVGTISRFIRSACWSHLYNMSVLGQWFQQWYQSVLCWFLFVCAKLLLCGELL